MNKHISELSINQLQNHDFLKEYLSDDRVNGAVYRICSLIKSNNQFANHCDVPLCEWSADFIDRVIDFEARAFTWLDIIGCKKLTVGHAEKVFDSCRSLRIIPIRLQTHEMWLKAAEENSYLPNDPPVHIHSESFWLRYLNIGIHGHGAHRIIPLEEQTPAIAKHIAANFAVKNGDIRKDLMTDEVVGLWLSQNLYVDDFDKDDVIRGMKWMLDNGAKSISERYKLEKSVEQAFSSCCLLLEDKQSRDHYQAFEELRRFPIESVLELITDDYKANVFREVFGSEAAMRYLGKVAKPNKKKWLSEDLGL